MNERRAMCNGKWLTILFSYIPLRLNPREDSSNLARNTVADIFSVNEGLLIEDNHLIDAEDLKCVFVMAQAGTGKTSLLRHLGAKLIDRLERERTGDEQCLIPIFVRADQLWNARKRGSGPIVSIDSLVSSAMTSVGLAVHRGANRLVGSLPETTEVMDALKMLITTPGNGIVLLLDALDEVAVKEDIREDLKQWVEQMEKAVGRHLVEGVFLSRLIVSSRPNVFRRLPDGFDVVSLEALSKENERLLVQQQLEMWQVSC